MQDYTKVDNNFFTRLAATCQTDSLIKSDGTAFTIGDRIQYILDSLFGRWTGREAVSPREHFFRVLGEIGTSKFEQLPTDSCRNIILSRIRVLAKTTFPPSQEGDSVRWESLAIWTANQNLNPHFLDPNVRVDSAKQKKRGNQVLNSNSTKVSSRDATIKTSPETPSLKTAQTDEVVTNLNIDCLRGKHKFYVINHPSMHKLEIKVNLEAKGFQVKHLKQLLQEAHFKDSKLEKMRLWIGQKELKDNEESINLEELKNKNITLS